MSGFEAMNWPEGVAPLDRHYRFGPPSMHWAYRDPAGAILGYVTRFDPPGKPKEILPQRYGSLGGNEPRAHWKGWSGDELRPLYNLDLLAARPDAPVLVCEGEKTADAGATLFPDCVATTPLNGSKATKKADWSPLTERDVWIARDLDEPGAVFERDVATCLQAAGAASVRLVDIERLAARIVVDGEPRDREGEPKKSWDLADALDEGWTAELLAANAPEGGWLVDPPPAAPEQVEKPKEHDTDFRQFRRTEHGVEMLCDVKDKETGEWIQEWRKFCSPLSILAYTRDGRSKDWGRLLEVTDPDGILHRWAMPMEMLGGSGEDYRRHLLGLGLRLEPGDWARKALQKYLTVIDPKERRRCVDRIGWHDGVFVLPEQSYGPAGECPPILQVEGEHRHAFAMQGSLDAWRNEIARLALGNSRLVFALSVAAAAPLLHLAEIEGGGFHVIGASSIGKTTMLEIAGSFWGGGGVEGYKQNWRATANALEAIAAGHCDALLAIDEMSQIDANQAGQAAYMLANGAGKRRADRRGGARKAASWRTLFLSSGEISLADKLAEDHRARPPTAGQAVRVLDFDADAGAGLGAFEELHGHGSAGELADRLKSACRAQYGTAADAFLDRLTGELDEARAFVRREIEGFAKERGASGADGQVERAAARFALVAAAGELARSYGLFPWEPGEARRAAGMCFDAWLARRGGCGPQEDAQAERQIRAFVEAHGGSRFEDAWAIAELENHAKRAEPREAEALRAKAGAQKVRDRVGFRRTDEDGRTRYYVLPEAWRNELCKGHDPKRAAAALAAKKLLLPGSEGDRKTARVTVPGHGRLSVYELAPDILGADAGATIGETPESVPPVPVGENERDSVKTVTFQGSVPQVPPVPANLDIPATHVRGEL